MEHLQKHMRDALTIKNPIPAAEEVQKIKALLGQARIGGKAVPSEIEKLFRQLRAWHMTEDILRETKIGVEVAEKFWRDKNAPERLFIWTVNAAAIRTIEQSNIGSASKE